MQPGQTADTGAADHSTRAQAPSAPGRPVPMTCRDVLAQGRRWSWTFLMRTSCQRRRFWEGQSGNWLRSVFVVLDPQRAASSRPSSQGPPTNFTEGVIAKEFLHALLGRKRPILSSFLVLMQLQCSPREGGCSLKWRRALTVLPLC